VNEITRIQGLNKFILASKTEALAVQMSVVNVASDKRGQNNLIGDFLIFCFYLIGDDYGGGITF
jgi:hypothetical protein